MSQDSSALRAERADLAGARLRLRLDWRTFAYLVAAILAALALFSVVRNTTTTLARVGIGIVIALALDPLVTALQRRSGVRRGVAVAIVATGVLAVATMLVAVLGPAAVEEAGAFSQQLPETIDELESLPLVGPYLRENDVGEQVQEWIRQLPEELTDERLGELAGQLVSGVASVAIVVVMVIAVLIDGPNLLGRFRRLLSAERRAQADEVGAVLYRTLGRYFGGSLTVAILMGLFVLTLGLLLGIPLVVLAAVWAMITSLIPQVGGFLGGTFLVLLASTEGVTTALIAAVAFVAYMNLENHVIQPLIVGRAIDLRPATTMVAAIAGAAVAGVPGAIVATPLVGAAKAIYLEVRGRPSPIEELDGGIMTRIRRLLSRRSRQQADSTTKSEDGSSRE